MTNQDIELLLLKRCEDLNLKQKAFDVLEKIFTSEENNAEAYFWGGFDKSEIKLEFEGYKFILNNTIKIRTIIRFYIEDKRKVWFRDIKPIGYYELETDLNGQALDDFFAIEKEKYIGDVAIIDHFHDMNQELPKEYLSKDHLQYEYVAYISLVGTLFISKDFEGSGQFVKRALTYLETVENSTFDKRYLKKSKSFLKMMKWYLMEENLLSDRLLEELHGLKR